MWLLCLQDKQGTVLPEIELTVPPICLTYTYKSRMWKYVPNEYQLYFQDGGRLSHVWAVKNYLSNSLTRLKLNLESCFCLPNEFDTGKSQIKVWDKFKFGLSREKVNSICLSHVSVYNTRIFLTELAYGCYNWLSL